MLNFYFITSSRLNCILDGAATYFNDLTTTTTQHNTTQHNTTQHIINKQSSCSSVENYDINNGKIY